MFEQAAIVSLLQKEVSPAVGCTAPVAVGLAVTKCREVLGDNADIRSVRVIVSPGIFKNGYSVGIPNSGEKGNVFGAALGAVYGDSSLGLAVFSGVSPNDIEKARRLLQSCDVSVVCDPSKRGVYIEGIISSDLGECHTIMNTHSNIVCVTLDGKTVYEQSETSADAPARSLEGLSIESIISFAETVPFEHICFLLDGINVNMALAQDGLAHDYRLNVGKSLRTAFGDKIDLLPELKARMLVSAAADARMGGSSLPAMSTVGSGNQGITAILPVAVLAKHLGEKKKKTARALAISHLVTYYVKQYIGRISSMCLCGVAASAGAGCAITWLRGGNIQAMKDCIKNILAALTGMICDGAKGTCALKMGVATAEAFRASDLAIMLSSAGSDDGIIDDDLSVTLKNVEKITQVTRDAIDDSIVEIINAKE